MFDNEKKALEQQRKLFTFMKSYISLPSMVIGFILTAFSVSAQLPTSSVLAPALLFFAGMITFWANNHMLEEIDKVFDMFYDYEKERSIKDLNPHKHSNRVED